MWVLALSPAPLAAADSAALPDQLAALTRIDADRAPHWWRAAFGWRPALSVALVSLVIGAALLIQPPRPAPGEALDADRIERALDDVEMLRQLDL